MTRRVRTLSLNAAVATLGAVAALATPAQAATIGGCRLLPRDFPTNQRVDRLPVAPDSNAIVDSIGLDDAVHPDFGSGTWEGRPIGIPYDVVTTRTARERISFAYADESDRVRYPIPRSVHIEGGRDAAATATRCWSSAAPAGSTSCSTSRAARARGARAPARPGTCAATASAPGAGRAPTPPACRSCRCSPATRRSSEGGSTTPCASRSAARGAPTSTPRATSPRT